MSKSPHADVPDTPRQSPPPAATKRRKPHLIHTTGSRDVDDFDAQDRRHLIGLLEQLGSLDPDVRATVGAAAAALMERRQRSWSEVLRTTRESDVRPSAFGSDLGTCCNRLACLTDCEREFIRSIARLAHHTPRQIRLTGEIADRLCAMRTAPDIGVAGD